MKVSINNYHQFKQYVLANGDNDGGRCVCVNVGHTHDLTMCFNNSQQSICVCSAHNLIDKDNMLYQDTEILPNNSISLISRLIELSKEYKITERDKRIINFYINEIEPASSVCKPCKELDSISL